MRLADAAERSAVLIRQAAEVGSAAARPAIRWPTTSVGAGHAQAVDAAVADPVMEHLSAEQLEAGLDEIRRSPADRGRVELIVRRPAVERARGPRRRASSTRWSASWATPGPQRRSTRTPDGSPHPDMQLNVMNARAVALLAGSPERRALAGDQLYLDLDLSEANLPAGTRLELGVGRHRGHGAAPHRLRQVLAALRPRGAALRQLRDRQGAPAPGPERPRGRARRGPRGRRGAQAGALTGASAYSSTRRPWLKSS